jgi:DNA-binding CsgD family transcriptional regulator
MTRAELEDRIAVLEEALGFRDAGPQGLPPRQRRIAATLARGPLPPALLAEVMGITPNCLARHMSAMRRRGVKVRFAHGAYRMEVGP